MLEMKSLLRNYGITVALTAPDAYEQLVNASAGIDDRDIARVRERLLASGAPGASQAKSEALPMRQRVEVPPLEKARPRAEPETAHPLERSPAPAEPEIAQPLEPVPVPAAPEVARPTTRRPPV